MIYNTNQFTHFISLSTDDTYKIEFYFDSREIKTVYIPEQENVSLLITGKVRSIAAMNRSKI